MMANATARTSSVAAASAAMSVLPGVAGAIAGYSSTNRQIHETVVVLVRGVHSVTSATKNAVTTSNARPTSIASAGLSPSEFTHQAVASAITNPMALSTVWGVCHVMPFDSGGI